MSRIVVSLEARVSVGDGGRPETRAPHASYSYWSGVIEHGNSVTLIARRTPSAMSGARPLDPEIAHHLVDDFSTPRGITRGLPGVLVRAWRLLAPRDSVAFVRLPGVVGIVLGLVCLMRRRPLVVHLVGAPGPAVANVTRVPILNAVVSTLFDCACRFLACRADGLFYVDESLIPPAARAIPYQKRNIDLREVEWAHAPKAEFDRPRTIIAVGTHEKLYKGHDLLLEAADLLAGRGTRVRLRIVGDGRYHRALIEKAERLNNHVEVDFLGHLGGIRAVQDEMSHADLFVLPSRTEGFPRALIEAAAMGLPCLATDVGAVRAVLPGDLVIHHISPASIANAIDAVIVSDARLRDAAAVVHSRSLDIREEQRREDRHFIEVLTRLGSQMYLSSADGNASR